MVALACQGVELQVDEDSFVEEPVEHGDLFGRALSTRMVEARGARARRWSFRTLPIVDIGDKVRMLLEGRGQCWNFDSATSSLSGAGVTNTAAGSFTRSATLGKYGGHLLVGSDSQFGVQMSNKLGVRRGWAPTVDGWTLGFWTERTIAADGVPADGWYAFLLHGAVSFLRAASSGNPAGVTQWRNGVQGSHAAGYVCQVDTNSPYVAIYGKTLANTNAAKKYDDMFFWPFELPSGWATQINTFMASNAMSNLPAVKLSGDLFRGEVVRAVCRVRSIPLTQRIEGGVVKNNEQILEVVAEEF